MLSSPKDGVYPGVREGYIPQGGVYTRVWEGLHTSGGVYPGSREEGGVYTTL